VKDKKISNPAEDLEKIQKSVSVKIRLLEDLINFNSKRAKDGAIVDIEEWIKAFSDMCIFILSDLSLTHDDFRDLMSQHLSCQKGVYKEIFKARLRDSPKLESKP
jgi:hypothetical protein